MDIKKQVVLSFSGKDSTLALYHVLRDDSINVRYLIATVNEDYNRSSMHGIREELLDKQAKSLGLEIKKVYIPKDCSHETYKKIMGDFCENLKNDGIEAVVFGDLLLEDVKKYREDMLALVGLEAIFPLWGRDTTDVVKEFLGLGFKTLLCCIDMDVVPDRFLGKVLDDHLLGEFIEMGVDPAGENGEYHSFVFDGPIFEFHIDVELGDKRVVPDSSTGKDRFCFVDVI